MSEFLQNKEFRIKKMIEIVQKLKGGAGPEAISTEYGDFISQVTPHDILNLEKTFLEQGVSVSEIKMNIEKQLSIFKVGLDTYKWNMPSANHPLKFYMEENRVLNEVLDWIATEVIAKKEELADDIIIELNSKLIKISKFENHYVRKENIIFPFMEKLGYEKPMGVMWSLDDDARNLWKKLLKNVKEQNMLTTEMIEDLQKLVMLMKGTIFKENKIIFPVAMDRLTEDQWEDIYKQSLLEEYFYIEPPTKKSYIEETKESEENNAAEGYISLGGTGLLKIEDIVLMLNHLPVDITFVDNNDRVRYFSTPKDRIFPRSAAIIDRKVQNCHPPESIHVVEQVVRELKEGKDSVDFWLEYRGRFVYIRYMAVRDEKGNYQGTLEVTQDVTEIRNLQGEKRLLDHN